MILYPLLMFLAALQYLDGWTTSKVLARGGTELNPIMRKLFSIVGVWPAVALKGTVTVLIGWYFGTIVTLGMVLVYTAVVIWNLTQFMKM